MISTHTVSYHQGMWYSGCYGYRLSGDPELLGSTFPATSDPLGPEAPNAKTSGLLAGHSQTATTLLFLSLSLYHSLSGMLTPSLIWSKIISRSLLHYIFTLHFTLVHSYTTLYTHSLLTLYLSVYLLLALSLYLSLSHAH